MSEITTPDGVDLERLSEYFKEHVPDIGHAPLQATLIAGGRSNLTYSITDGIRRWVLRRPPLGHVLPTAHDMAREYKVMTALQDTEVPVPRTLALCEDITVNDAPFYVMEQIDGIVYRDPAMLASLDAQQARRCSEELIDVLVRIHSVDYASAGLGDFGRPDGYLERQVRRWGEQWERSKTAELPQLDELARRLRAALPTSGPATIVHGDYRLDNTMISASDPGNIVAVLDWEMSTLGDPLADLGLFLLYWGDTDSPSIATGAAIAGIPGFFTRDEVVNEYAQRSGRNLDSLEWYEAFASYKLAIIVEGINARFQMGKTLGEGFEAMASIVAILVDTALERTNSSTIAALCGE
ncbi:MAG: phosphotransferase family protein [Acidimicrobiia bacterium]|nr:phosphotransferase family protein [Acidimicrobiia bacterium]